MQLYDVVRDPQSKTPSLIFEFVDNEDFRSLYARFTDNDVRYYIFEVRAGAMCVCCGWVDL